MNQVATQPSAADEMTAALALLRRAVDIANRAVISDIETECQRIRQYDCWWYDTRPMLSLQEFGPEAVDMAAQALQYALDSSLIEVHPQQPHLVRIVHMPE